MTPTQATSLLTHLRRSITLDELLDDEVVFSAISELMTISRQQPVKTSTVDLESFDLSGIELTEPFPPKDVFIWTNSNNLVGAIKLIRHIRGCGLKEAKDMVDNFYIAPTNAWVGPVGCVTTQQEQDRINTHPQHNHIRFIRS